VESPEQQRVRTLLPYLKENGWQASILTVDDPSESRVRDERLLLTVPAGTEIVRARCPRALPGFHSLGLRSYLSLKKKGQDWIQRAKPDLVYLSTTEFDLFCLGPSWKKNTGVPYVLDYQDPWLTDYYERPGSPQPPGGRWKYAFSRWRAQRWEPGCVEEAAGISSVSPAYLEELQARYPRLRAKPMATIPFGISEVDWRLASRDGKAAWNGKLGHQKIWLNLGRLAPSMRSALASFFLSLAKNPPLPNTVILFLGSSYEAGQVSELNPVVLAASICPQVRVEAWPGRLPLLDALSSLQTAHRLLFFGSDDPGYLPSRLQPYLKAEKPLLAVLHQRSPAWRLAKECGLPGLVGFLPEESQEKVAEKIVSLDWSENPKARPPIYSCDAMTRDVCRFFEESLGLRAAFPSSLQKGSR
jgi:hypothetical protein